MPECLYMTSSTVIEDTLYIVGSQRLPIAMFVFTLSRNQRNGSTPALLDRQVKTSYLI